jgi:hypothetical protein
MPITPEWLTAVLRQAHVLREGVVLSIEQQSASAFNSRLQYLLVHYSAAASPGVPTRLVLKQNIDTDWAVEAGAEEVKFYNTIASLGDHPLVIPPCYAAVYDETSGASYLLLHDLSETHAHPITRDQHLADYKHGLIFWLLMPVQDRYGGAGKDYWWPKMQCLVGAFRDWHCDELLGM